MLYLQLHTVVFFLKSLLKKSPCSLAAYQMNAYVIFFYLKLYKNEKCLKYIIL